MTPFPRLSSSGQCAHVCRRFASVAAGRVPSGRCTACHGELPGVDTSVKPCAFWSLRIKHVGGICAASLNLVHTPHTPPLPIFIHIYRCTAFLYSTSWRCGWMEWQPRRPLRPALPGTRCRQPWAPSIPPRPVPPPLMMLPEVVDSSALSPIMCSLRQGCGARCAPPLPPSS